MHPLDTVTLRSLLPIPGHPEMMPEPPSAYAHGCNQKAPKHTTDSTIGPKRPHFGLHARVGADIFERLAPNQSTRTGARAFQACGVGVVQGGFLDKLLQSTQEGIVCGIVCAIPAYLLGLAAWQVIVLTCAFFLAYDQVKKYLQA